MTGSTEKPFETKLAHLIRMLGTEHEGEAIAAWGALKRLLASRNVSFTDLGDAVEKLATGGLEEAEMKRLFEAGRAEGARDARRTQAEAEAIFGKRPDRSTDWEAIALFCQHENARLRSEAERTFVDDMAARLSFPGREPTEKQATWLLAIFRRLGGRIK
jgi:hypothetical protein